MNRNPDAPITAADKAAEAAKERAAQTTFRAKEPGR